MTHEGRKQLSMQRSHMAWRLRHDTLPNPDRQVWQRQYNNERDAHDHLGLHGFDNTAEFWNRAGTHVAAFCKHDHFAHLYQLDTL